MDLLPFTCAIFLYGLGIFGPLWYLGDTLLWVSEQL